MYIYTNVIGLIEHMGHLRKPTGWLGGSEGERERERARDSIPMTSINRKTQSKGQVQNPLLSHTYIKSSFVF